MSFLSLILSSILTYPFLIYDKIANVHSNFVWLCVFGGLGLLELWLRILEKCGDLFEDRDRLFENLEHLLEELSFLLETNQFIRTISVLLETFYYLLENNRNPLLAHKKKPPE